MRIPRLIREARRDAGLTQEGLAKKAGTSQPAVARYEQGVAVPTLPTLERLLLACGRRALIATAPADDRNVGATSIRGRLGPGAEALRRRRALLLAAARKHGARKVRVFGSLARGEEHQASDVDLLVDLGTGRTLLDLVAFRREAGEILGVPVDVATPDMLKERVRDQALQEALPL